ncbi:uncharacterized protein ARMOST_06976 [Armillaria ostoyae]|uniref:Reverse transcriptase domain-containing protein n=1 Tax=Armillaria ostoyae TaxID=47428 RepID=A0A284R4I4_ARMOS|nr:uncharacterized protein ARMOST_06976 [Armillaria ostoyae]
MATPKISIISTAAFVQACAEDGAQQYTLQPSTPSISGKAGSMALPDMSDVPADYHDFADVFSDLLSKNLLEHRPYDLKINLEEGTSSLLGPIYSLLESELKALHEFIDDNLYSRFITLSRSPHRAPVLFVKKKTGELHVCVNFHGLNKISKKNRYSLPLISDLLGSARSTCIYTKLDLRHAYHLVCIAEGDEWKTAFQTCCYMHARGIHFTPTPPVKFFGILQSSASTNSSDFFGLHGLLLYYYKSLQHPISLDSIRAPLHLYYTLHLIFHF